MNEIIRKDIIGVLLKAIEYIDNNDNIKLRELSDYVIHNASIFQDEDSISVVVIIYTLSKLFKEGEKVDDELRNDLINSMEDLKKSNYEEFRRHIKKIYGDLANTSHEKHLYFKELLEKAEIKKGSKMFYHGISLARVAQKLGLSRWELMEYVGKTSISENYNYGTDIEGKLEFTRKIFGVNQ
ncbi:hypothetical protein HOA56_02595 [archaeon]|nr:hypothetical protein [archaeon]